MMCPPNAAAVRATVVSLENGRPPARSEGTEPGIAGIKHRTFQQSRRCTARNGNVEGIPVI
jgi:hypothetical protein